MLMRHRRSGKNCAALCYAIVCAVALVPVLFTRVAPPSFPRLSTTAPTVNSQQQHDQRPCFDQGELYAYVATATFSPAVTVVFSPLMSESRSLISADANGTHYTRPPPLG